MMYGRSFQLNVYAAALCAALFPAAAYPQTIQWVQQFGARGTDWANAVATAPNAIYAAGQVNNSTIGDGTNAGGPDAYVAKLDLEGKIVWTRQFGSALPDVARGVAANATGVYVAGEMNGDLFVRKYDPDGNELWTRQFGGPNEDHASAAAADATGLYVVGWVVSFALPGQTAAGQSDAFIRKYDFNGNELWTRQFGTASGESASGVAADSSGVYVTGETNGALATHVGGTDMFLRKYDSNGTAAWTRQFGTSGNEGAGYGGGVAVNSTGVYITSVTTGTFPGQTKLGGLFDAFVQKFDLSGAAQWVRQFGTSDGDDWGYGIVAAGQTVYAAGQAGAGLFVWLFDANGGELGNLRRGTFSTEALGIAADSSGVYLAGGTSGAQLGQTGIGDKDSYVLSVPFPPAITGISDAFTGQVGTAPTTWTAIYGSNLATTTRTWDDAIAGAQLPASLDDVRVTINGRPATVFFISPNQVNVLPPLDETAGNVNVTVTNRVGTSLAFSVRKANFLPAFYAPFADAGRLCVTAVALDGTLVGKPGVDPRVTRPARPGEIIQVFATGFGPTNPAAPSDQIFVGAPEVATRPRITIGGREATFAGAGNLVSPGLYQFNVTVPDLADGDHAIVAEAGGSRSAATVLLSVRR